MYCSSFLVVGKDVEIGVGTAVAGGSVAGRVVPGLSVVGDGVGDAVVRMDVDDKDDDGTTIMARTMCVLFSLRLRQPFSHTLSYHSSGAYIR